MYQRLLHGETGCTVIRRILIGPILGNQGAVIGGGEKSKRARKNSGKTNSSRSWLFVAQIYRCICSGRFRLLPAAPTYCPWVPRGRIDPYISGSNFVMQPKQLKNSLAGEKFLVVHFWHIFFTKNIKTKINT